MRAMRYRDRFPVFDAAMRASGGNVTLPTATLVTIVAGAPAVQWVNDRVIRVSTVRLRWSARSAGLRCLRCSPT